MQNKLQVGYHGGIFYKFDGSLRDQENFVQALAKICPSPRTFGVTVYFFSWLLFFKPGFSNLD
jgi:hypothetical protein